MKYPDIRIQMYSGAVIHDEPKRRIILYGSCYYTWIFENGKWIVADIYFTVNGAN